MDIHKGERPPLGTDGRPRPQVPGGARFRKSHERPLRCDGSKHAAGAGFQSTTGLTRSLAPQEQPSVQVWARHRGDFFTRGEACVRTRSCRRRGESDTPRQ
ncbi:hypothetical protein SNL152K_839 [Streptomyces sp. NL15-2K]|nr:hypothetical protein SNL152K_839 [Streptomyces sp. NL15-2K]